MAGPSGDSGRRVPEILFAGIGFFLSGIQFSLRTQGPQGFWLKAPENGLFTRSPAGEAVGSRNPCQSSTQSNLIMI